jgi:hypothetical protein
MKLDKETVIKHQFWFLLGSYLLIWFIAVLWLKIAAGGPIETAKKDYEKQVSSLDSAKKNPVNVDKFLPPWNAAANTYNKHKNVIWDAAWKFQEAMYDWPKAWDSKDMHTPKTELSADERFEYQDKWYPEQIKLLHDNAPNYLSPIELAGGFDGIFQRQQWKSTPTREEIWLAQEDYWVKRELLLILWKAMADLAYMEPIPIDDKEEKPEGVVARYRYANQSWEITLNLRKDSEKRLVIGGDSTLKNVDPSHRPQALTNAKGEGIWFNVSQEQLRTRFEVRGEPIAWNETRPFSMGKDKERKDYEPLEAIDWEKMEERPIVVSEAFDQTNSPIRRLSALALAKQDCRTYAWVLQPNKELEQLDAPAENPNDPSKQATPPPGPGAPPGPGGGAAGGGPPGGGGKMEGMGRMFGGGAMAAAGNTTPNNDIERNRYLQPPSKQEEKGSVSPPSRHLPVALKLVVEQSHMHDVVLALVNSRLRVQVTQVEFQHNKDYVPQSDEEKKDGANTSAKAAGGRNAFMGIPGMMAMGMRGKGMGGMQMAPASRFREKGGMNFAGMKGPPGGMGMAGMGARMGGVGMRGFDQRMMRQFMGGGPARVAMSPAARMKGFPLGPGGETKNPTDQDQHDDNLVDLTIYGIATLYRHPDAPASEQLGQPGQPGEVAPPGGKSPTGGAAPNLPPAAAGKK